MNVGIVHPQEGTGQATCPKSKGIFAGPESYDAGRLSMGMVFQTVEAGVRHWSQIVTDGLI
jgi:hypothetical protein